jgi:phosphoenolpyruvate carboxykinase (ATP)
METQHFGTRSIYGLENHGLYNLRNVYWNISPPELVEQAVLRKEGELVNLGALVVNTGYHSGRSPHDKYFVQHGEEDKEVFWNSDNKPIAPKYANQLYQKLIAYLQGRDVFVKDMMVGAHPEYALPIRVVSEKAFAGLFSHDLFLRLPKEKLEKHIPEFTILHCPDLHADPKTDGTVSSTFVLVDLHKKLILIGNSGYAGEIKKSIFTIMNFLLPRKGVMSMHCSANLGKDGDAALFFGLSGTGKTTLSSDPNRFLIGDDEHGWAEDGVFNFEGGCYAKVIRINPKYEPIIYQATRKFGTLLENVVVDPETRLPDFDSSALTENTRAAYPIDFVDNHVPEGRGGHPKNVFFLTADAFGVLPPISKLSTPQASYYFLAGYTSKLAGTEVGLGKEPQATFSMCFGAPFMPLSPGIYADLLGKKIEQHNVNVWLVNTGWTGGPYGIGHRFELPYTRAIITSALEGELEQVPMHQEPFFKLWIPESCTNVPSEVLNPRNTWEDKEAYDRAANELTKRFAKNFEQFKGVVSEEIYQAGPGQ